jgi:putative mRNA 3-end processing factor
MELLELRPEGLYCPPAGLYLDPWKPVERAVITHGHSDHAKAGHGAYLAHPHTLAILRHRLGLKRGMQGLEYGQRLGLRGGVKLSLWPAGHVAGSAQVLLEKGGDRWVFSGDYLAWASGPAAGLNDARLASPDSGASWCTPFESVPCRVFITESTFALPLYRWPEEQGEFQAIQSWWQRNSGLGRCSVLVGYALGKAQRLAYGLAACGDLPGELMAHPAVAGVNDLLGDLGYPLPRLSAVDAETPRRAVEGALIIAPPAVLESRWLKRLEPLSLAFASGWMRLRGPRRRHAADRGFVVSDHADWDGLLAAVAASGAERVGVTHGFAEVFSRWLREQGLDARPLSTRFEGESGEIREGESSDRTPESDL